MIEPKVHLKFVNAYWRGLKTKSLSETISDRILPDKSLAFPFHVYCLSNGSLDEVMQMEIEHICKGVLNNSEEFFSVFPKAKNMIRGSLFGKEEMKSLEFSDLTLRALDLIGNVWPDGRNEVDAALVGIVPFKDEIIQSYCNPRLFGLAFLNFNSHIELPTSSTATAIIHETAHHALFVETARDRLIAGDVTMPIYSPIKKTDRPAIAALHGLVAMVRMLTWGRKLEAFSDPAGKQLCEKYRALILEGIKSFKRVELTKRGIEVFREIEAISV